MRLFDSHTHVSAPEMLGDAPEMLERARDAGVDGVIAVGAGYGLGDIAQAVALASLHPDVWATAGLHPHDAAEWSDSARTAVDDWLDHDRVVAVGECGLDYWYEHSPRETQRECLQAQIGLARAHGLPLVIHVRPARDSSDAFEELLEIFDESGADAVGGIMHCFTGNLVFANSCLERGFDISFSGILSFRSAEDLRRVAAALPLERLLIETDSPLLAPTPHRGRPNQPAWVGRVAECLAEVHGQTPEYVADATTERARHRFGIDGMR